MRHPLWTDIPARAGIAVSSRQLEAFDRYLHLLAEGNQRLNLTRIVDPETAAVAHVADSLMLLPYLPAGARTLADVGSGGGAPGMILAIARPDLQVTLIESTGKKADFLKETAEQLGLEHVRVESARAEQLAKSTGREAFDVVTARAVAPMDRLVEWCMPLVRVGGIFLAMKGGRVTQEMPAARKLLTRLGGGAPKIDPAPIPGGEAHVIVSISRQ